MTFSIKILGSGGAIPAYGRNHSAHLVNVNSRYLLFDCGEGAQLALSKYKIKPGRIESIFISHLHGDHYLGLMGLLSSMDLLGRTKSLKIYGPVGLKEILLVQMKYSHASLGFEVDLCELDSMTSGAVIQDSKTFQVHSFPLNHRIPCWGFLVREKPKPYRILKDRLLESMTIEHINILKGGESVFAENGDVRYSLKQHTLPPKRSRTFAYCSDTRPSTEVIHWIAGADLMYHEATFLSDREQTAARTYHSTARQAAEVALKASVGTLVIGHFSARYKNLEPFLEEATEVFPNTHLAIEGQEFAIPEEKREKTMAATS